MRSLINLAELERLTLEALIERGLKIRDGAGVDKVLAEMTVANLFFEPSTRTQLSFDLAAQRLGAYVLNFNERASSTVKGETFRDTVETIAAIGADILIVRHRETGSVDRVAAWTGQSVVNAGEGTHAHPTQGLLDCVTLLRHFGSVDGLRVGVVGDVAHSRVGASLARILPVLGVELINIAPSEWLPLGVETPGASDFDSVIGELDVVYLLRVQTERGAEITAEYIDGFQLNADRLARMHPDAIFMHPGPVNRGIEIESALLDDTRSLVAEQVANGVPTRMAVLEWLVTA